ASQYKSGGLHVMDVRKPGEFEAEHVEDAESIPLDFISEQMDKIDENKTYHIHCAGGYRSVIASSILKSRGFHKLVDIAGGYKAIKETDIPTTNFVCPTTLK
ncbi:MAG: rhodanese-like domain-containing protein, partial [Pseudomonadales bacterium]